MFFNALRTQHGGKKKLLGLQSEKEREEGEEEEEEREREGGGGVGTRSPIPHFRLLPISINPNPLPNPTPTLTLTHFHFERDLSFQHTTAAGWLYERAQSRAELPLCSFVQQHHFWVAVLQLPTSRGKQWASFKLVGVVDIRSLPFSGGL